MNLTAAKRQDERPCGQRELITRYQSRLCESSPLGFYAGDTNLYRYVFNRPTNLTDPSGLDAGTVMEKARIDANCMSARNKVIDLFKQACGKNKIDAKIVQQIIDAVLGTSKPFAINPCLKWTQAVDAKLPPRNPGDEVIGAPGLFAGQASWIYESCAANLWCLLVDGHFAIKVKLPDGQVFYFDDGNWGGAFLPGAIPRYAK